MKCEIRIVSGARAGHRDVFDKSYIGIGRHPLSDVRFDAEKDLDASTRHAAIVMTGDAYLLRDLGSRNGTFVNGEKIEGDRTLADGDKLRFGVHGPEAEFHVLREQEEVVMAAVQAPPRPSSVPPSEPAARETRDRAVGPPPPLPATYFSAGPEVPRPRTTPPAPSTTSVLRAQVMAQASRVRAVTVVLVIVMIGAAALLLWQGRTATAEREVFGNVLDSLNQELRTLRSAKAEADSTVSRLQRALALETDPSRRQQLQRQLGSAQQRQQNITVAQGVDYNAIKSDNDRAIAIIYVRFADTTQMWTGTAFSVSTSGVMITNRHVVLNPAGERPRDIAIQFSGSTDVLPARLVRVAADADLAVLQLESQGPFPAVAGLADGSDAVAEGAPIALLGFPGGGGAGAVPRATLVTGSVTRALPDSMLELDAYSGQGASGSPIFDRNGRVIGVEFGGIGGRIIRGLPVRRVKALLPS